MNDPSGDIFSDDGNLTQDLALLDSLSWVRKEFVERVCAARCKQDQEILASLRSEPTYIVFKFFYVLPSFCITTYRDLSGQELPVHDRDSVLFGQFYCCTQRLRFAWKG
jgi:hypothetical protein